MVDTGELENYLNEKSAKTGDIVEILNEGVIGEIAQADGTKRRALNISVKLNGSRDLIWTPGKTATKQMVLKTGKKDSKGWVGLKCSVDIVKQTAFGQLKDIVILTPIEQKKA
jgi:hypothetical protein